MSLQIGRITGLPEPSLWRSSGETLTLSGFTAPTTLVAATALRDQLLGYSAAIDEPVIPIVVDSEPRLSGYYRIQDIAVPTDVVAIAKGYFAYTITAERITAFHGPMFEDVLTAANRVGPVRVGYGFIGIPSSANEVIKLNFNPGVIINRTVNPSDVLAIHLAFFSTPPFTSSIRFALPVGDYYRGRCSVQTADGGGTLREAVGRQLYAPDLTNWVISNGLVKVEPSGSGAGRFQVTNAASSGSWGTPNSFSLWNNTDSHELDSRSSLTLLRNAPEECILRLAQYQSAQLVDGALYLDIRVRRGQRSAEFMLSSGLLNAGSKEWQVIRSAPLAMTVITGAMRQTANDASGNRLVVGMAEVNVQDVVNCAVTPTSTNAVTHFMIGAEVPGGTVATYETAQMIFDQYCAVVGERVIVAGR